MTAFRAKQEHRAIVRPRKSTSTVEWFIRQTLHSRLRPVGSFGKRRLSEREIFSASRWSRIVLCIFAFMILLSLNQS